jgi:signal transduction histidine kinase
MNRRLLPTITIFILFALGIFAHAFRGNAAPAGSAAGPVILTDKQGEYPLGLHMEILEDPTRALTVEEVSSPAYDNRFFASPSEVPVFGFTDSAYWVRFHLKNNTHNTDDWLIDVAFSNMQYIDLYTPLPNGEGFSIKQSGALRPPATRELRYPRPIFIYTIAPQEQSTIYMRFQSGSSMTLHLTLWQQTLFFNNAILEQISFGIFFGILVGLLFYNLFILLSLKEMSYFYIVLLLFGMILHEASYNGFLETYVIPGIYSLKSYYHPVLYSIMMSSMILFADSFLELKKRAPKLHWITLVSVGGFVFGMLLIPFTSYRQIATLLLFWTILSFIVLWVSGIYNYVRGKFPPARIFMLAWFGLVVLVVGVLLVRLGVLPSTFFTENTYRLGILLVAIFWSVSLADRVHLLKAETENANQELHKSEQRLSQILDSMPLAVVLYAKDYKAKYANRRTYEILRDPSRNIQPDLSAGRTLAQALEYFSLKMTGSHKLYPVENFPVYHALKGNPAFADDIEIHKQEKLVPLEMWASPITNEAGNVESTVVVFQDITERRQIEAELAQYRQMLESLVEQRTAEVNAANKELRLHLEWLAAVNLVNQMIAHSADFSQIHIRIVEIIRHLFDNQDAFIAELDADNRQLKVLAHSGSELQPDLIGSSTSLPEGFQSTSELEPGSYIMISQEEFSTLNGPMGIHIQHSNLQSILFVPLQVREHVLGFLGLEMHEAEKTITDEEANLLSIFSTDIAQLIEDARLFEQAKMLAAAEERNRLARELHDSVAQALYSISLFINATRMALDAGKPDVVKNHLEELTQLSREAMRDMRLLIFELRPPILDKSGLAAALQSRLESVEAKAGFEAHFESEGVFHLSAAQETELYGIAQEALNNITKHAQATQVKVRLAGQDGCIRLVIEDNGIGFDPLTVEHRGGQGFRNMRERAANIGARCSFEAVPGQGTKITIEVNE